MIDVQAIALAVDAKAKKHGNRWRVTCPSPNHEDRTPSCDLEEKNGKLLWHCHGCKDQEGVRIGIEATGLYRYEGDPASRAAALQAAIDRREWLMSVKAAIAEENPDLDRGDMEVERDPMEPIPVDKFSKVEWPPATPLLGPINAGSVNLIGGTSAVGKSWFGMAIANAAGGQHALGHWKPYKPCDVLLVDGELTGRQLSDRQAQMDYPGPYDIISSSWSQRHGAGRLNLMSIEAQAHLIAISSQYDVVILDNLFGLFPSSDKAPSTTSEYWQIVDTLCVAMKQQGCAVVMFDHMAEHSGHNYPDKDSEYATSKLQGTVTKRWSADTVAVMMRSRRAQPGKPPKFMLSYSYQAGGKTREQWDPVIHDDAVMQFMDGWFRRCA